MRIVLSCLPSLGGSAITAVALAGALADRGHTVAMVAADPPFGIGATRTDDAGSAQRGGVTFQWPARHAHPVLGGAALAALRVAELVGTVARDLDADVVNPHYLGGLLPACALAVSVLAPRSVLVATAHGTDVTDPADGTVTLTSALLRSAAGVTAVSPYLARQLSATFGLPALRVRVIPNWVDAPPNAAPVRRRSTPAGTGGGEPLTLVHVSNYRPVKRAARCADALAAAAAVGPARLLLVGDGPDRVRALDRAGRLGVSHLVEQAGVVDPATAYALLAGADVVLLPSASEACSGVLLQALAAGVPAVAYDVAGNSGVARHGRSALLVPDEDDASGFAAATRQVAACPDLRATLSRGATRAARRFTRERTVDGYEAAYVTALTRRTRRPLRAAS